MPPKKNNNSKPAKKPAAKKSKKDDDDALLAAMETTAAVEIKKQEAEAKESLKKAQQKAVEAKKADVIEYNTPDAPNPYPEVAKGMKRQTWPEPTIPVRKQFAETGFPLGQRLEYPLESNAARATSEEKIALEAASSSMIYDLRHAAEVHRQVRTWAMGWLKPGLSLHTITNRIEFKLRELIVENGLEAGQAFPTGVSLNSCAAHYTPNTDSPVIELKEDDVLKIDYGTHINGRIIDSAFTWTANPVYDPLVEACKAATNEGIKQAGIDVRLCDVGAAIQEVMESHEVELNGRTYPVKSIRNLSGHSIDPYIIHAGKSVPIVNNGDPTKMLEGELFAIETFGSTGRGMVVEDMECSHYMTTKNANSVPIRSDKAKALLKHIQSTFSTLPFCRKWLDNQGQTRHTAHLNQLCDAGAVDRYPPLCDIKGCFTAQSEHTILMGASKKEVLSRGLDY